MVSDARTRAAAADQPASGAQPTGAQADAGSDAAADTARVTASSGPAGGDTHTPYSVPGAHINT